MKSLVARRPAETTTLVAAAIAGLLGSRLSLSAEEVGYLTIIVGAVPATVTGIVNLRRRQG